MATVPESKIAQLMQMLCVKLEQSGKNFVRTAKKMVEKYDDDKSGSLEYVTALRCCCCCCCCCYYYYCAHVLPPLLLRLLCPACLTRTLLLHYYYYYYYSTPNSLTNPPLLSPGTPSS